MITDAFDPQSQSIINPKITDGLPEFNAFIITFSHKIEEYVVNHDRSHFKITIELASYISNWCR